MARDTWLGLTIVWDSPAKWGKQNKNPKSKIYSKCQLEWRWSPCFIIAEVAWKLSSCATSVCECMLQLPRYWRKPLFCFYPKFLESFNQRSFTAEHLRKEMVKGKFCFFSKRGWLSHNHTSSVFAPCYRKEFWPSFEINQLVPQRFCHNLSAEFWYQKWEERNTVPFHSC